MYSSVVYRCNKKENWKGTIYLRTWDEDGNSIIKRFPHKSELYYEDEKGSYTSVYGNSLSKIEFDNIFEKKRWKDDYNKKRTYGEFAPEMEFIQNMFYGYNDKPEFFNTKLRIGYIDIETAIKRGAGNEAFDTETTPYPINLISIYDSGDDTTHVFMYLNSTWYNKPESEYPWKNSKKIKYYIYHHYHEMLNSFLIWWKNNTPDVITGWNVKLFDLPYIINECYKVLSTPEDIERGIDIVANHLSPLQELIKKNEKDKYSSSHISYYDIQGVNTLDYKNLYKDAYGKKLANFKLETVCQEELKTGKLENPENSFYDFYTKQWEKFVEYNIIDVYRVKELEDKLKYIELAKTVAYTSLIPLEKVFITTPVVIGALNQEVKNNDRIMITSTGVEDVAESYKGGYVKDPLVGIYNEGIFSIDLNSLYPNIMITLNISNETYVGKIVEEDANGVTININGKLRTMNWVQFNNKLKPRVNKAANNALFLKPSEKEGVIPSFLSKTYNKRRATKNKMLDCNNKISTLKDALKGVSDKDKRAEIKRGIEQLDIMSKQYDAQQIASKLLMNSLYGLFANPYSPVFNTVLAEAITLTGQNIIKGTFDFINDYAKKEFNIDYEVSLFGATDSGYINAAPFLKNKFGNDIKWTKESVQNYCNYIDNEIVPIINKNCTKIVKDVFWSDFSTIEFKRETMCSHGAFVAKLRYCLLVRNDEGTPVNKWKYVGLSHMKNEYTKEIKDLLKYLTETMIINKWTNSQFNSEIYAVWEKFNNLTPEEIGIIKGWNTYKEYLGDFRSEDNTQAHVRAIHYYNDITKRMNLDLPEISLNEKCQYVILNPSYNKYHIDVIGFDFKWPKEFNEEFEIDRLEMFNKIIIKPLEKFIKIQNYSVPNVTQVEVFDINTL